MCVNTFRAFFIWEKLMEKIEFIASLPASEIEAVMKLIAMKGQAFKVTIEEER